MKIYVVMHEYEYGESSGSDPVEYFVDRVTAEEFRNRYVKHWEKKTAKDDFNRPDRRNTYVEERELHGFMEIPSLDEEDLRGYTPENAFDLYVKKITAKKNIE